MLYLQFTISIIHVHSVCPPPPPPKKKKKQKKKQKQKKHCIVYNFSWDIHLSQEKFKTVIMQNFWGGKQSVLWAMWKWQICKMCKKMHKLLPDVSIWVQRTLFCFMLKAIMFEADFSSHTSHLKNKKERKLFESQHAVLSVTECGTGQNGRYWKFIFLSMTHMVLTWCKATCINKSQYTN